MNASAASSPLQKNSNPARATINMRKFNRCRSGYSHLKVGLPSCNAMAISHEYNGLQYALIAIAQS